MDHIQLTCQFSTEDFEFYQTLGRVKIAKHKISGIIYAIKVLKKYDIIKAQQIDHVHSEMNINSQIKHPFIVSFQGKINNDEKYLYYIFEFIGGGELFTLLRSQGNFTNKQSRFYCGHIITIFEYLHSKNIIYRDLKPENILIASNGYIKLSDFGLSKKIKEKTYTFCGTPEYLAPEIILNRGYGKAVDWWTLGILLYEMIVGIDPFSDVDPIMIYQKILIGNVKFPSSIDKDAKSLIKHLLQHDISKRYGCLKTGIKDIVTHRFYRDFDWKGLLFMKLEAPYIPKLNCKTDTSNFVLYPDSNFDSPSIKTDKDPFLNW